MIDKLDECPNEYGTNFNGCNYKHIKIEAENDSSFHHMRFWYAIAYEYEGVFGSFGWYMILLYKLDFSQLETKLRYYRQDYQRNSSITLQENGIELRRDVWK